MTAEQVLQVHINAAAIHGHYFIVHGKGGGSSEQAPTRTKQSPILTMVLVVVEAAWTMWRSSRSTYSCVMVVGN